MVRNQAATAFYQITHNQYSRSITKFIKGILLPGLCTIQHITIAAPARGLLLLDCTAGLIDLKV